MAKRTITLRRQSQPTRHTVTDAAIIANRMAQCGREEILKEIVVGWFEQERQIQRAQAHACLCLPGGAGCRKSARLPRT
jgi:hypothetical protein